MNKHIFYAYAGGNGAIYIFNLSSFKDISVSLEFYKPLGSRRILKKGVYLYLCFRRVIRNYFPYKHLISRGEVQDLLADNTHNSIDFNVDEASSIFISSSGDKVIVHHHNNYYEKFSFENSYEKSCNELEIYSILKGGPTKSFMISDVRDIKDYNNYCSFKLYNDFNENKQNTIPNRILINALVELYQITPLKYKSVSAICTQLKDDFSASNPDIRSAVDPILNKVEKLCGGEEISLGLVHWDFKIWNIQAYTNKIQIYDFEESKLDGLPLEDLYNYHIDSRIMAGETTKDIASFIKSDFLKEQLSAYLQGLHIQTSNELLLLFYLLYRICFYEINGGDYVVQRYLEVLKLIEHDIFRTINVKTSI